MFKTLFYIIFKPLASIWHCVYGYKCSLLLRRIGDKLYTYWIGNSIRKIGKTSVIGSKCYLVGGKYIEIGEGTSIGKNGIITCWEGHLGNKKIPTIKIGNNCSIGECCHITAINSIIIGDGVLTGKRITVTDNSHGRFAYNEMDLPPLERKVYSKGQVIIENNVWIGDKATITAGVTIGKNSIIGANAVVTKDVPAYSLVAGNPAKVIKHINK